ncbi:Dipeptidyl aminopeptidase A [Spathaspora sp. JA1]|nr:Dipeptidyl aminopeptidase A [Spathaspora sp. JA1]
MFSRNSPPNHVEEYEMVEQQEWSDTERIASNSSQQTPSVDSRESNESDSSIIFEDIENYSARQGKDIDDFNMSPTFQNTFIRYKKQGINAKICGAITIFFVALWVAGVIVYSQLTPSQLSSKLTWKTDVTVSGSNITLNQYDASFRNLTLESYRKGHYAAFQARIDWLSPQQYPEGGSGGGYYLTSKDKKIIIKQINTKYEKDFLSSNQFGYSNNFFYIQDYVLNPTKAIDDKNSIHILKTDILEQWRDSSFALYWIYNPITGAYTPIQPSSSKRQLEKEETLEKLHFAEFSPRGNYILFGHNHDLFIYNVSNESITQITNDGSSDIFNGKSDWVYEEEIISKLYWWSPDENYLIFGKLNDTNVQNVDLNYYIKGSEEISAQYAQSDQEKIEGVNQYPISTFIKYPKPGTPVPVLSLFKYGISEKKSEKIIDKDTSLGEDYLLYDAIWIDDNNFLMKQSDRTSSILSKKLYSPSQPEIKLINSVNVTAEYNGWVGKQTPIQIIPNKNSPENKYVEIIVIEGRNRLALFDNASASSPAKILTDNKDWDVLSLVYDSKENFIYFKSTIRSSMDCHLSGLDLTNNKIISITNIDQDGFYDANFSPDGQYLDLFYSGPEQPWQKLINMADIHEDDNSIIEKAAPINLYSITKTNLQSVNIPTTVFKEIKIDKDKDGNPIKLNVKEILPPNFSPQRKYPLFVYVYGGPGSQLVQKQFDIGFLDIISSKLDAIVLVIDPRGTGGKGWAFASYATNRLGYWEPRDVTLLTSEYIAVNKKFINPEKVALWGWSYGGYTTLKCLEYDNGKTFKFGMAVAPVTNWLFYDSVYTERYMNKPDSNPNYETANIKEFKNFKSSKRFLIVHGTSDDNVHFQNSLWLLDKFALNEVENFDIQIYPDSAHDISYDNAASLVYDRLFNWVRDAFMGKFD